MDFGQTVSVTSEDDPLEIKPIKILVFVVVVVVVFIRRLVTSDIPFWN